MSTTFIQRSSSMYRQMLRSRHLLPCSSSLGKHLFDPLSSLPNPAFTRPRCLSTERPTRFRRRKRPHYGKAKIEGNGPPRAMPETTGLTQPLAYGGADGESTEDYLKKTSLSPWVPTPDPIARKLFDMSAPTPEDIHVELGCGDGRVNFYAIDHGKVKKSTGIDIDDGILKQARERLMKRHPQPPIEFIAADLLDFNNDEVWDKIQEATIITMYFVQDALSTLRPLLEEKLVGKQCKIITVSYPMPGWNHFMFETTLGTTCYMYNWGTMDDHEPFFSEDSIIVNKPKELLEDPLERMKQQGLDLDSIERVATKNRWDPTDPNDYWMDDEEEEDNDSESSEDGSDSEDEHEPSKSDTPSSSQLD